jgi:basic amino acid/polyamine antiporter, APA family
VPLLGTAICLAEMIGLPIATWERLLVWLVIGLIVCAGYGRRHATTPGLTEIAPRAPFV